MEEKILVKSKQYDVTKIFMFLPAIGAIIGMVLNFISILDIHYNYCIYSYRSDNLFNHFDELNDFNEFLGTMLICAGIAFIIGVLSYFWLRSYELTVTDKRIFGKVAWGKRVDLPVDSVSATATIGIFKGVSISTSSGRISFLLIKNSNEIYDIINKLVIERQSKNNQIVTTPESKSDHAEELMKYKELLDNDVITQEEFDAKKKQLLGL